ncbi:hypothetical protein Pth03_17380 [Planotetraspora thailandica]|uniref:Putative zinc-finger domain-containing protein n=1 Tax=Planotetraspora thailandica TaxID=487172 RepID=A0A8J3UWJ2_9ACTN|nr:zf-HC2 domain-containing protein [Planotetraspora thailandica]GII53349.1 hypothetical protein Pth03_17380 [Planotetraspora thailandica]
MSASSHHFDVAAYALGVLDDGDVEAFEAHLDECADCRRELLDAGETLDMLEDLKLDSVDSERTYP